MCESALKHAWNTRSTRRLTVTGRMRVSRTPVEDESIVSMAHFGMISSHVCCNQPASDSHILYMVFGTSNVGFYSTLAAMGADNQGNAVYK